MVTYSTKKSTNIDSSWKSGVAGFTGGAVSTVLLLPLDNVKVRLQVNEGSTTTASAAEGTANGMAKAPTINTGTLVMNQQQSKKRLGAIRMLRGVVKYEGVRGLYQGLVPAFVGSAVSWGGFFYVYESMKRQWRRIKSNNAMSLGEEGSARLNSWDNFVLGTASGAVMVFVTNPVWLIKLRLQLQMKRTSEHLHVKNVVQYDGFADAFRKIVRTDGFLGLYKGTGPALMLTSHGGVQFVVYEFLRKHFHYARAQRSTESSSVMKRFEHSLGYLTIGAVSKM